MLFPFRYVCCYLLHYKLFSYCIVLYFLNVHDEQLAFSPIKNFELMLNLYPTSQFCSNEEFLAWTITCALKCAQPPGRLTVRAECGESTDVRRDLRTTLASNVKNYRLQNASKRPTRTQRRNESRINNLSCRWGTCALVFVA